MKHLKNKHHEAVVESMDWFTEEKEVQDSEGLDVKK